MTTPFYPSFLLLLALLSSEAETAVQQDLPMDSFRAEVEATRVMTALSERRSFDYLVNASCKVEAPGQVK